MQPQRFALFILGFFLITLASLSRTPQAAAQSPLPSSENRTSGTYENLNIELAARVGGTSSAVAVQGNYAYVNVGLSLHVLDVSNPSQPLLVGQSSPLSAYFNDIVVVGEYAYVAAGDVFIFNVANPSSPVLVGLFDEIDEWNGAVSIEVVGDTVFVAASPGWDEWGPATATGLRVLDVSNRADPRSVAFYPTEDAVDVAVSDGYVYVLDGYPACHRRCNDGYLRIFDFNNPAAPRQVSIYTTFGWSDRVEVIDDHAFVTTQFGLETIDVSDPAAPVQASFVWTCSGALDLTGVGSYLYIADWNWMGICDISDPTAPTGMSSVPIDATARAVTVKDDVAYVAADSDGLLIFDVSDPLNLVQIGSYDPAGYTNGLTIHGHHAYVEDYDGFRVMDIRNPAAPNEVSFEALGNVQDTVAAGSYLYVLSEGDDEEGLYTYSLADPAAPQLMNLHEMPLNYNYEVMVVDGSRLYIHERDVGISVFDLSEPATPVKLETLPYDNYGYTVADNYLYLPIQQDAESPSALVIVDVSNLDEVEEVSRYEVDLSALTIGVAGDYAYLAEASAQLPGSLVILDISDRRTPREVGGYDLPAGTWDITVVGPYAFFEWRDQRSEPAWTYSGIGVLDVSNPADPELVGSYSTSVQEFAVAGDYIYSASGGIGLDILRFIPVKPSAITLGGLRTSNTGSATPFAMLGAALVALAALRHRRLVGARHATPL